MTSPEAHALAEDGFVVLRARLDPTQVAAALDALEEVFAHQADIAHDRRWTTDVYRVAYALPLRHDRFLELVGYEPLVAPAREVLGDDLRLSAFNGIDIYPGSTPQRLHRDHPHPTPGLVLTVQVVVALDPFRADTGATRVVPRSHRQPLVEADAASLDSLADSVRMEPGDAVAYDGALVHAGGSNRSSHPRRALHLFYSRGWVAPHWDLASGFDEPTTTGLTATQRALLGFGRGARRYDASSRRVER